MAYENILVERDGAVATLTVNRPKVLNALNRQTLDELVFDGVLQPLAGQRFRLVAQAAEQRTQQVRTPRRNRHDLVVRRMEREHQR